MKKIKFNTLVLILIFGATQLLASSDSELGKKVRKSFSAEEADLLMNSPTTLRVRVKAKMCHETADLISKHLIHDCTDTFWTELEKVNSLSARALLGAHFVEHQKDVDKGITYLKQAHQAGISYASFKLAVFNLIGLGVPKDATQALRYLNSDERSPLLNLCLAQYYEHAACAQIDSVARRTTWEQALKYAEKSATQGNDRAFAILMKININLGRLEDAAKWATCRLYSIQPVQDFYEFTLIEDSFKGLITESIETMKKVAEGWLKTVERKDDLTLLRQVLKTCPTEQTAPDSLRGRFWCQFASGNFTGFADYLGKEDRFRSLGPSAFHLKALTDLGYGDHVDFSSYEARLKYASRKGHVLSLINLIIHDYCCGLSSSDQSKSREFFSTTRKNLTGLRLIDRSDVPFFHSLLLHIEQRSLNDLDSKNVIKIEEEKAELLKTGCLSQFMSEARVHFSAGNYVQAYTFHSVLQSGPLSLGLNWALGMSDMDARLSSDQRQEARQKASDLMTKFPTLRKNVYQIIMDYFYTNETHL